MGLDISAYGGLVDVTKTVTPAQAEDGSFFHARLGEFPAQFEGLIDGAIYTYTESMGFRAGSYGGYNGWRDNLARLAGHGGAASVWKSNPLGLFVELINFSDCDGVIGPKVSAKLYQDFVVLQPKVDTLTDEWWKNTFANFRAAFLMASGNGAVVFH